MAFSNKEEARAYHREWYHRNKKKIIDNNRRKRHSKRDWVRRLKESTPCADCQIQFPHYVMDFDHRDGSNKVANVSEMARLYSLSRIKAEIDKCDLVCANCHRIRTFTRLGS